MLTPVERTEAFLDDQTVRRNTSTSLASRHFRNQLARLGEDEFESYLRLVDVWAPEIRLGSLKRRVEARGVELDLFYDDPAGRVPKEICWAGDGLQIWLQILLHVHRHSDAPQDVIVLDEPDNYLHADLQRRLVRLLEESASQTVFASHSPEVLGEAEVDNVLWVDRTRSSAVTGTAGLAASAEAVGSQFNLRMARALRARAVLFVEG